ncbi:MAG: hypothetical protein HYY76_15445 [Acidobacteria bacterium]|nr:hypothetical protein [Acidobacteriota bacterium]
MRTTSDDRDEDGIPEKVVAEFGLRPGDKTFARKVTVTDPDENGRPNTVVEETDSFRDGTPDVKVTREFNSDGSVASERRERDIDNDGDFDVTSIGG